MMKSFILCVVALASLPNTLAINCYTCTPAPPGNSCTSNLNISNCDNFPGAPPGMKYDTCGKFSYEISFGGVKVDVNAMTCGIKSMCAQMEAMACNGTAIFPPETGITVTKCEAECCDEDECNGLEPYNDGYTLAASFITAFLSLMAVFTGGFIY